MLLSRKQPKLGNNMDAAIEQVLEIHTHRHNELVRRVENIEESKVDAEVHEALDNRVNTIANMQERLRQAQE